MWLTVLLIALASCEWVEISQQHYRKPTRTHHEYGNQTILPQKWIDRNTGVTRIESSIPNKYGAELDRNVFTQNVNLGNKDFVGTVERVPSVGVIQRVQLPNTPVKSPVLQTDPSDKLYTNFELSLENDSEELPQRVYKTKQQVDTKANQFEAQQSKVTFKNYSLINDDESNHFMILNTKITNEKENIFYSKVNKITENAYKKEPISQQHSETNSHQESIQKSKEPNIVHIHHTTKYNEQNLSPNNKPGYSTLKDDDAPTLNIKEQKPNDKGGNTEASSSISSKANTMETLIKIMKIVADTISQNSHRSLRGKVRYLHELKNSMLDNIENRIDTLWPDDESDSQNGAKRRARSAHDSARGHVEFPSSESALMTISFLTFAVFLVKLVLQVIQTYKNKTMMVAPLVVATAGRAAVQRLQNNINNL